MGILRSSERRGKLYPSKSRRPGVKWGWSSNHSLHRRVVSPRILQTRAWGKDAPSPHGEFCPKLETFRGGVRFGSKTRLKFDFCTTPEFSIWYKRKRNQLLKFEISWFLTLLKIMYWCVKWRKTVTSRGFIGISLKDWSVLRTWGLIPINLRSLTVFRNTHTNTHTHTHTGD